MLTLYAKHLSVKQTLNHILGIKMAPTSRQNYISARKTGLKLMKVPIPELDFEMAFRCQKKLLETWIRKQAIPMTQFEVKTVLRRTKSIILRARIALTWCLGLRVADAERLQICDILQCNPQGILFRLRGAKGAAPGTESYHRVMPAKGSIAQIVYSYCKKMLKLKRPEDLLFPASGYSRVLRALKAVNPKLTCHSIRRDAATHLAHEGRSLEFIRRFLGHKQTSTTRLYINPSLRMNDLQKRIRLTMTLC